MLDNCAFHTNALHFRKNNNLDFRLKVYLKVKSDLKIILSVQKNKKIGKLLVVGYTNFTPSSDERFCEFSLKKLLHFGTQILHR